MGIKTVFKPIGWLLGRIWWFVDGLRRALFNILLLLIIVSIVWALIKSAPKPLADRTLLVLNLDGQLVEQSSGSARSEALARLQGRDTLHQVRLRDVVRALDDGAKDPKIWAALLDLDDFSGAGQAGLHEVAAALARFKAAGKPVLAYGDNYSQRAYYLAAQGNEVYMNPMGLLQLTGFGGWRNYYKDALDRLGVEAHLFRVGTFKSFGEPYIANAPSPAALEADAFVYDALWGDFGAAIEQGRKLARGSVKTLIDTLPERLAATHGDMAQLAVDAKFVDALKTRDEMRALLIKRGAADDTGKSFRQVGYLDYLTRQPRKTPLPDAPEVAVVVAEGEIVDGDADPGMVGGDSTARLVRQAREDAHVKAIVLRVNSPGGSAYASEVVRRELELARKDGKKVVVSMGDVAASGGYWITMASDRVIADPDTITGSIGVFAMLPTADKLLDKLSVHTGGYTTTWLAGAYDPRRPMDPRFAALMQAGVQHTYDEFTAKAAQARGKTPAQVDAVAQGRIWTGRQALERGLIDALGSFDDAIKSAEQLAGVKAEDARIRYVEKEPSRTERLLQSLDDVVAPSLLDGLRAQLGFMPPKALVDAGRELAWLSDRAARGEVVAHCLCGAP
ncbi:MAG: signal peptide peptidase SppA [Pelomonas sp.]|nr:signal peptide peptidase SppA [Roseateles sp.]